MKTKYKIIAFSIAIGLLFWVIDSILDYFMYYTGTFWELLVTNVPPHEVYTRITAIALFLVFGAIVSVMIEKRKQAEERAKHLTLVLRAIRNVNQLITREKDREKLLQGACDNLTETRGYYNAWVVLLDESGKLIAHAESWLGKGFLPMVECLKRGELPVCGQRALKQPEVVVTEDPFSTCTDCPLSSDYAGRSAAAVRLEYQGKVYGFLSVSVPREMAIDVEELGLFQEVATDIAFALYNIGLEEQREQVEEALRESEEKLRLMFESMTDGITVSDMDGKIVQMNEAVIRMHGYNSKAELIGRSAFELITEKDHARAMENMKRTLGDGFLKNIEYTFLTRNGSEFPAELSSAVLRDASGELTGLIAVTKDITERKPGRGKDKAGRRRMENNL